MFITVPYKDSCNYHKSLVKSARHSSYDKGELTVTLMVLCETACSPGNNSNVSNILKVEKKKGNKKSRTSEIYQLEQIKMTVHCTHG